MLSAETDFEIPYNIGMSACHDAVIMQNVEKLIKGNRVRCTERAMSLVSQFKVILWKAVRVISDILML